MSYKHVINRGRQELQKGTRKGKQSIRERGRRNDEGVEREGEREGNREISGLECVRQRIGVPRKTTRENLCALRDLMLVSGQNRYFNELLLIF